MKQGRRYILFISLFLPLFWGGSVLAATQSMAQEIHVTAIVPSHRDIVVDHTGQILSIASNTTEDVTPDVYLLKATEDNKQPLTPEMLALYRKYVPEGTAKYGVLYSREASLAQSSNQSGQTPESSARRDIVALITHKDTQIGIGPQRNAATGILKDHKTSGTVNLTSLFVPRPTSDG